MNGRINLVLQAVNRYKNSYVVTPTSYLYEDY